MDWMGQLLRGMLGVFVLLAIAWAFSSDRRAIKWKTVAIGIALQVLLGIAILKIPVVENVFAGIAGFFRVVLDFTEAGATFVLGDWPDVTQVQNGITQEFYVVGYIFAFKVLPTILFFSALTALLYYLGILQFIIKGFAWVMSRLLSLSGAESTAAAANVFIGQTEAPLVVKPYLEKMSRSEILCLMTGGMATIAGSVFAAFVGFLGQGSEAQEQLFATHLLTASIMSAPAAIVAAKMLVPETKAITPEQQMAVDIPRKQAGSNVLDAVSKGTSDGLRLAVNVGAMLLVFTAFIAMFNYIISNYIGSWTGLNAWAVSFSNGGFDAFNMEFILSLLFAPFAWLIGIPSEDILVSGQLLGIKTTLNEFIAYSKLQSLQGGLQERSVIILTYALCGFSNFASIGIQIGGISAIAPGQRKTLTELGLKALIGGTIACFLTATIAGVLVA